ncbi:MAG: aminopeptidase [Candidatus Bipolaricaulis sp.]|nr:aminopeptidase [Candidatus Bipolaricaulis sp.]MDD5219171.1 aminopeptidase [Candidatus Bipolaricaulis sp.]MDD5645791.1 aminopeptidase [Candidatus Bipolaricaulis sp.]
MFDPRVAKLAEVLVQYSVGVRPDDTVFIQGGSAAMPLMKAVVVEVLRSGGHPYTRMTIPDLDELVYRHASDAQLRHVPEPTRVIYETYDAMITFWSSENTKSLTNVAPEKLVLSNQATKDIFRTFMQRVATQDLRWVGTLYPTAAYAQDAEMGLHEYEDFVYGACLPDPEDPVAVWREVSVRQQRLVDWLAGRRALRVEGHDVDLRMSIAGRTFKNCDGKSNMPDGEIFTGPVEDSVEGEVRFSYPTVYQGRKLAGVRLEFEKGKVVRANADTGEDFLLQTLDIDEGARYVGEFAVGTNRGITRATGNTLFDEKINGSFHMALGAGMPETGSRNESAIHWDMVCDLMSGGRIYVDDKLIYESGRFLIEE